MDSKKVDGCEIYRTHLRELYIFSTGRHLFFTRKGQTCFVDEDSMPMVLAALTFGRVCLGWNGNKREPMKWAKECDQKMWAAQFCAMDGGIPGGIKKAKLKKSRSMTVCADGFILDFYDKKLMATPDESVAIDRMFYQMAKHWRSPWTFPAWSFRIQLWTEADKEVERPSVEMFVYRAPIGARILGLMLMLSFPGFLLAWMVCNINPLSARSRRAGRRELAVLFRMFKRDMAQLMVTGFYIKKMPKPSGAPVT